MSDKRYQTKICEQCGNSWETRTAESRTCSMKCAALIREKEYAPLGKKRREYPPEIVKRVGELHASGLARAKITEIIGPGYSVQNILRRHFSRRRERGELPVINRKQVPEQHGNRWKGDEAGYKAFHVRVGDVRGKPEYCACCDISGSGYYHWANLTGNYEDVNDYIRLCVSCHVRFDNRRREQLG
jgi:hypothetical protein